MNLLKEDYYNEKIKLINIYLEKFDNYKKINFSIGLYCKENKDYIDELNKKIDYCLGGVSEKKFQNELEDKLKNFKFNQNLKHLNIYLIGKSGSGKSTLVNEILFNGEEIAKTGKGNSITKEHKEYNSENIPWLNIHDNRGD